MSVPTFLIVGAAKAGTTSIYKYLSAHPDVFMSTPKEPRFLTSGAVTPPHRGPGDQKGDEMSVSSWEAYQALFGSAGDALAIGESSVETLYYYRESIPVIQDRLGTPKIVIALRDPVERAFSAYRFLRGQRRETLSFRNALRAEDERLANNWEFIWGYRQGSLYADAVAAFVSAFPDVHVVLFDDLVHDAEGTVQRLLHFLDVPPLLPENTGAVFNKTRKPLRSPRLASWRRGKGGVGQVLDAARSLAPRRVRSGVRKMVDRWEGDGGTLSLDPADRDSLAATFRDDVQRLERILGADLSSWLQTP